MSKFLDKTGLDTFWAKIKSTFQTLGNLVTAWGSTPSDTKYPSEKLVFDEFNKHLSYFDATYVRNNASGNGWVKLADVNSTVRSSGDINGVWDVVLVSAATGVWRDSITLDVRFYSTGAPVILLFNRHYELSKKTSFEFCVKVVGLAGSGNSTVELWAKVLQGWLSIGIRETGAGNLATKRSFWNYYSYASVGGSSKPTADPTNNIQVADPTFFGADDFLKLTGGNMSGPLQGYLMSTRATMVGNEYNCLLNAKERGILTFTQSGSGQLTNDAVWELFDGKIIPKYGPSIDPEDPYILTLDLSSFINSHCQVFSAFGWTCRYWEPLKFKVELYDTYNNVNEWVTICDYSQTQYTGQHSGGGTASLFVKFGSGTVNPHTGVTRGGMFKKIRITIWKGNESSNKWGISEIFFCYPENYSVYGGLHAYSSNKISTARQLAVSLSNTSTNTSFDGSADVTNIKTTGTLGLGNGGTGKTTAKAAEYNLTTGKSEISDTTSGDDRVVFELASPSESNGVTRGFRKLSTIWTWIKGLLSSESGVNISGSSASCTGNAATATTAQDYDTSTGTIKTALDSKVDFGLSNNSSNIGNGAPAADCISYWGSDNIPNNHIKMVYNVPGSEATLIFSKRSTYGSIVKYGYADKYVYILRNQNGTWKSNDWEKISAGYADSAGTATTATDYNTSSGTIKTTLDGKMATSGSNATSAAGGNIIRAMDDWNIPNENNEAVPAANITSGGTGQGRYTFAKIWNWITSHHQVSILKTSADVYVKVGADTNHGIYLDYDASGTSPTMGLWVRWGSGSNSKWMAKCDSSGNCTFNGTSESAKEIRIPYGSGSVYLQIGVSGSGDYLELGTNMANGVMVSYAGEASQAAVAGRLGTTSVGSASNPIYLNNGVPTACNWWVS